MNDDIPGLGTRPEQQMVMERVVPPQDDLLTTITVLSRKLTRLIEEAENQSAALEKTQLAIKEVSEKQLPDLMSSVGLTEMMVAGRKVFLKDDYFANVSKERQAAAFAWLRERNMGSVIKEEVVVPVSSKDALIQAGIAFEPRGSIHASTLKALVKEQIEAGNEFPRELFGVHVATKAVVK